MTHRIRRTLIALNAHPTLPRAAICRLSIDLDGWLGRPASPERALALGLTPPQLGAAVGWLGAAAAVAQAEVAGAHALGARIVTFTDAAYPERLRELTLPPPVVYVRGSLPARPGLAIVGSRAASDYGTRVADLFGRSLAAAGEPVVSGLARGIDAAAHRGALDVPGGETVAVLGCGLAVDYPLAHRELREAIAAGGAVVSELPCGAPPLSRNFPVRNRIIAALSRGVIVVEAAARSGSLSTARHALDLGRDVWAVPGRIFDPGSTGTNALLRDGAGVACEPRDVLPEAGNLPLFPSGKSGTPPATPPPVGTAARLLACLAPGDPASAETVASRAGVSIDAALATLLELELDGWVRRHPGPLYDRP